MARRSALGTERSQAAIEAIRMGCTREAAAGVAGVTRSTFYRWMDDGTFRDEIEKAEHQAEAAYTMAVQQAVPKNWQAAAWWLERRRHQQYGRKDQVEVKLDIRAEADRVAEELGLDPDTVLAEAVAILGGKA
jgi:transposase-like protein